MANFLYTQLGKYRILWIEPGHRIWASQGYTIFFSDDFGETFTPRATLPVSAWKNYAAQFNLAGRAIRAGVLSFLPLQDGSLLAVVRGRLLRCPPDADTFRPVLDRPGRTLKIEETVDGAVYAAEYFYNAERTAVHVFGSHDHGQTWETAYTFAPGTIRHVHLLINDPDQSGLLVLTGDENKECMILRTRDGFRSFEPILTGSQSARAMGIAFAKGGYYLATDTPYEQNYIQYLSIDGALEKRCPISGSCLAVCQAGAWSFFGTAVEPSEINHDHSATIYATPNGREWQVVQKWPSDFFSYPDNLRSNLFQMARIVFPMGINHSEYLFATTVGVKHSDGILHRWKIL